MNAITLPNAGLVLGRLGWPGLTGLLMAALAGVGAWQWLPAWRAAADEDEAQVAHLRRQLQQQSPTRPRPSPRGRADKAAGDSVRASGTGASAPEVVTPALARETWARAWAALPTREDAVARQAAVLSQAAERGVSVPTVQYRGAPLSALPLVWRQQMVLPVEGPYPALRDWLGAVLRDRAVSLDALDVVRADPMGEQVKARVALSVWWRQEAR